jgi:hypothetical protein
MVVPIRVTAHDRTSRRWQQAKHHCRKRGEN